MRHANVTGFIGYLRDARIATPQIFQATSDDSWMLREVTLLGMGTGYYELPESVAKTVLLMDLWENDLERDFDDPEFMCYICQARQAANGIGTAAMETIAGTIAHYLSLRPCAATIQ